MRSTRAESNSTSYKHNFHAPLWRVLGNMFAKSGTAAMVVRKPGVWQPNNCEAMTTRSSAACQPLWQRLAAQSPVAAMIVPHPETWRHHAFHPPLTASTALKSWLVSPSSLS